MSLEAIRRRYGVPATRGRRVKFEGRVAIITSAEGYYLRMKFLGADKTHGAPFHPLWHIDWMDGIDHDAAYEKRMAGLNR